MLPSAWLLSCHNTGLTGHSNSVRSLVVSPDGKFVATGCLTDNSIILWDPEGGAILAKWATIAGPALDLVFSCGSRGLACLERPGSIVVWNVENAQVLGVLERPSDTVHHWAVAWSPDDQQLASGSGDGAIRIWDTRTYAQCQLLQHNNSNVSVMFVAFSPDGKLLASCRADTKCCIWEVDTGELKYTLNNHSDIIWASAFDHNSRRIATVSDALHIWSLESGDKLLTVRRRSHSTVVFTNDGKHIMLGSSEGTFMIVDTSNGEIILAIHQDGGRMDMAQCSPDGKYIVSASRDGTVCLWNGSDGTCAATLSPKGTVRDMFGRGHVAFACDGRSLVSGECDGRVYVRKLSDYV